MSVKKWSTEFGIQEIDESQIATVKRWRSLKSVDCTKMGLTVKLKINMLPDLLSPQLYFIILVMCSLVCFVVVFFADYTLNNKGSSHLECYWFIFWFLSKTGFARMHEFFSKDQENCWNWENESWWTTVIIEATTKHLLKTYVFDAIFFYNQLKPHDREVMKWAPI